MKLKPLGVFRNSMIEVIIKHPLCDSLKKKKCNDKIQLNHGVAAQSISNERPAVHISGLLL